VADDLYPIIDVAEYESAQYEELGSREKFWMEGPGGELWLYKKPRPTNLSEIWSEKLAAEIAYLIGVPCAEVQLAKIDGDLGTISKSFNPSALQCFHENEVLANVVSRYDTARRFGQSDHNVKNIIKAISWLAEKGLLDFEDTLSELALFAMLDGLIGNTDRHHENWMIILNQNWQIRMVEGMSLFRVAPSYDHASSLGRELNDDRRQRILSENRMLNYIVGGRGKRGKGRVYADENRRVAFSPLRLAQLIGRWQPEIARPGLERLGNTPDAAFRNVISRIPPVLMSDIAKNFAYQFVITSKAELLRSVK